MAIAVLSLSAVASITGTAAAASVPDLNGEEFTSNTLGAGGITTGTVECLPDGSHSIAFTSTGDATGPYPGTFTETGTFTNGPDPDVPLKSFASTFVIRSGSTVVFGSKTMVSSTTGAGVCSTEFASGSSANGLAYEATICLADGTVYRDEGTTDGSVILGNGTDFEQTFFHSDGNATASAGPCLRYAALGDSFSSGEGAPDEHAGWTVDGVNTGRPFIDECHRSDSAYPKVVTLPASATRTFVACSGAVISDYDQANHNWGGQEGPQRAVLSADTDVVTLTMGGNDLGFGQLIAYCVSALSCNQELDATVKANIDGLYPRLVDLYKSILQDTSNRARVWVLGYPRFLAAVSASCTGLGSDEISWFNSRLDQLNGNIKTATQEAGVHFVPTADILSGHEVCTPPVQGSELAWANPFPPMDPAPFHPNVPGHAAMAQALAAADGWPLAPNPPPASPTRPPTPGTYVSLRPLGSLPGPVAGLSSLLLSGVAGTEQRRLKTILDVVPNAVYRLIFHSDPVDAGTLQAGPDGTLVVDIPIPDALADGPHTLTITGPDIDDPARTMQILAPFVLEPPPAIAGSAWYTNGTNSHAGGSGTEIRAYAVGAFQNLPYELVLATTGCLTTVAVLNPNARFANASGFLSTTAGAVPAGIPPGSYVVCFKSTLGQATATGPVGFSLS